MIYLSCQDKAPYTNRSRFMIVDRGERQGTVKIFDIQEALHAPCPQTVIRDTLWKDRLMRHSCREGGAQYLFSLAFSRVQSNGLPQVCYFYEVAVLLIC